MYIYKKLNQNLQNIVDYYIRKNNKYLNDQLHIDLLAFFINTHIDSITNIGCILS